MPPTSHKRSMLPRPRGDFLRDLCQAEGPADLCQAEGPAENDDKPVILRGLCVLGLGALIGLWVWGLCRAFSVSMGLGFVGKCFMLFLSWRFSGVCWCLVGLPEDSKHPDQRSTRYTRKAATGTVQSALLDEFRFPSGRSPLRHGYLFMNNC